MAKITIEGTRTQTIRTVVVAAFAALAVVLLAILGIGKLKAHGFHFDLPGQLGADISQTANGFTYSQSQRGHTIFTIHAARIVEFKKDQAELFGVAITLYGPEGTHREDRISGSDFLYDRNTGIVTAKGNVLIDMASPAAAPPTPGTTAAAPPDNIHVETSNLRFDQKSGEAQTDAPLAFRLPRAEGKAIGGDYNSKTGVLILQSAVELHASQDGTPSVVYAQHAQLLRDTHIAYLLVARSEYEGGHNSADQAILHFRPDGTLQHLDAENHVHMVTAEGSELYSSTATAEFDEHSQPLTAHAGGGVNFLSDSPDSSMHGNAVDGYMKFIPGADGKASLQHAKFTNAVSFVFAQRSLAGDPRGSATREMTASRLDIDFAPAPPIAASRGREAAPATGKAEAQRAVAQGGAAVDLHDIPYGAPPRHTTINGEQLIALLNNGHELRQLDGSGGTKVTDEALDGATDTSTGDTLHVTFLPIAKAHSMPHKAQVAPGNESAQIDTAVQQGHVAMVAMPSRYGKNADGSPQQPLYADALTGTFHSSDGTLHLTGDTSHPPRVHNSTLALTATAVDYLRNTGDATATGDVRSTYLQKPSASPQVPGSPKLPIAGSATPAPGAQAGLGGAGPVHIIATTAHLTRSTDNALFLGDAQTPARMWQGANSVTAPVLDLTKQGSLLNAHGPADAPAAHGLVHAVFSGKPSTQGAPGPNPVNSPGTSPGTSPLAAVTRLTSDTLVYSDTTRSGDFRGSVLAQQPDGAVHSDAAQIYLTEAPPGQPSQLDHMVAAGHVQLTQPGRRGTGEKLLYTAATGDYLLTGSPAAPPHAADAQHGDTTGAALLFRSGDNSVEVQSHDAEGNSRRTVTDTRTPK